ncbi:MAG TPA: tetratricopeptide repeat protein [Alcanivorax sp.]|nr:tetratricopeptide repeat protein [Alcanivorax sp.]
MRRFWLVPVALGLSVQAVAEPPAAPYDERYYNEGYQVLVAAGSLARAREVAENALYWRPNDRRWLERLATVAGWQGDAEAALAAWQRLAERHNDDHAWNQVLRLAPLTFNDELVLKARRRLLERQPTNEQLIGAVAAEYESLGRADEGLAFLTQWYQRHPSPALLRDMQRLAENIGADQRAIRYYHDYMDRYGADPEMASRAADLAWLRGDRQSAYQRLQEEAATLEYDPRLTRRLALMASDLGDWDAALAHLRRLTEAGDLTRPEGYRYLTLARYRAPQRLTAIYRALWRRSGEPQFALGMLYQYQSDDDRAALTAFFDTLTAEQWSAFQRQPEFLRLYATYLYNGGDPHGARDTLARALALAPDDRETRLAWLWLLITLDDDTALAETVRRWEPALRDQRRFWPPLAAAYMALDRPVRALRYETRMLVDNRDDWQRRWAYAQTLLAAGHENQAWPVLRDLWRHPPEQVDAADQALYEGMRSALVLRFAGGDQQLRFQQRELARTPASQRDQRAEWLAQWAIGINAPELARLWYLRAANQTDAGSRLSRAMLDSDYAQVAELRDQHGDRLTAGERLQADTMLGRDRRAAAQLAEQQRHAPALADSNPQQETLLLSAAQNIALATEQRRLGALEVGSLAVTQTLPFKERWSLDLDLRRRRFTSNDSSLLAVNETEQRYGVALARRGERLDARLRVGQRSLFGYRNTDLAVTLEGRPGARWGWLWSYQWQAASDETSQLLLGGQRTGQQLELYWTPASNWRTSVSWSGYDYESLDQDPLGQGNLISAQVTWRPWLSRFSPGVRLRHSRGRFDDQRPLGAEIDVMQPDNIAAVPEDYYESEISLLFGLPEPHTRAHRLQGWGELGMVQNSISGQGFTARVGLQGPLLGRDAWRLYLERSLNTGGAEEDSQRLGLDYRFYY